MKCNTHTGRTPIDEAIEAEYIRQGKHQQYLEHQEKHKSLSVADDAGVLREAQRKHELHLLRERLIDKARKDMRVTL